MRLRFMNWLFNILFHDVWENLKAGARHRAEQTIAQEYRRKFSTLQSSPLDESKWVARFVALDGDYMALEKEASELRIRNLYLSLRVKELEAK